MYTGMLMRIEQKIEAYKKFQDQIKNKEIWASENEQRRLKAVLNELYGLKNQIEKTKDLDYEYLNSK